MLVRYRNAFTFIFTLAPQTAETDRRSNGGVLPTDGRLLREEVKDDAGQELILVEVDEVRVLRAAVVVAFDERICSRHLQLPFRTRTVNNRNKLMFTCKTSSKLRVNPRAVTVMSTGISAQMQMQTFILISGYLC